MSAKLAVNAAQKLGLKKRPKDETLDPVGPVLTALDPATLPARRRKPAAVQSTILTDTSFGGY